MGCGAAMAVSALPRTRRRASSTHLLAAVSPLVLGLTLVSPTFDLLARVIAPAPAALALLAIVACGGAGAALLVAWLRYPRTSWLMAASLASFASLAMRLV